MKVLVTGGAGYIGSHTVQKLIEAGHYPVVFDNLSTGFRVAVPESVPLVVGDVRDMALVAKALRDHQIEGVIHFAAKLVAPESVEKPLEYYENNVLGTIRVLEACKAAGVNKFIFSSTAAVYGNPKEFLVTEDVPTAPLNPYGASKLMSERVIQDGANAHDLRYVILRYFNVAGASLKGNNGQRTAGATSLIKVAGEVAAGKKDHVEIFGTDYPTPDGTGIRDYIHVDDLADVHVLALESLNQESASHIYNVGYGHGFSVRDVIRAMQKVSGKQFAVKEGARREGDPVGFVADSTKAQKAFAWKPKCDNIDLICKTTFEWEKSL
ncbi:MAG: UDP-glucose 4-epimerase GalE [Bdellovibrionales bacterium]|nr:UDP-glucose 4-epimerase GalE [Bdellovibrionales bacterium]